MYKVGQSKTPEQIKALYLSFLFHTLCAIDIVEMVGEQWVSKGVKMRYNNFLQAFQNENKKNLEEAFNVNADGENGDAFIQALHATDLLVKSISDIPYPYYPDIVALVEAYKRGEIKLVEKEEEK